MDIYTITHATGDYEVPYHVHDGLVIVDWGTGYSCKDDCPMALIFILDAVGLEIWELEHQIEAHLESLGYL